MRIKIKSKALRISSVMMSDMAAASVFFSHVRVIEFNIMMTAIPVMSMAVRIFCVLFAVNHAERV